MSGGETGEQTHYMLYSFNWGVTENMGNYFVRREGGPFPYMGDNIKMLFVCVWCLCVCIVYCVYCLCLWVSAVYM